MGSKKHSPLPLFFSFGGAILKMYIAYVTTIITMNLTTPHISKTVQPFALYSVTKKWTYICSKNNPPSDAVG